jgi:hypothetical protein
VVVTLTMTGCSGTAIMATYEITSVQHSEEVRRQVSWTDGEVIFSEYPWTGNSPTYVRLFALDGRPLFDGQAINPTPPPIFTARLTAVLDCSVQPFRIVSISEGEATVLPDGAMSAPRGHTWPLAPIGAALVALGLLWALAGVTRRTRPRDGIS